MKIDLTGKTALVCGASKGIGKAIAIELALAGARVILVARSRESLQCVLKELDTSHDQKHSFLRMDFNDLEAVKTTINSVVQTDIISILINNSGGPPPGNIFDANPDSFLKGFNQHILCSHILAHAVVPGMRAESYGRIINIISTSVKQPIPGLGVSNTIRGAMASWAKTLASELAPYGITVNNVLPGYTDTTRLAEIIQSRAKKQQVSEAEVRANMLAQVPANRFAKPQETAAAVTFLASNSAAYITGINLPVDGGRTRSL